MTGPVDPAVFAALVRRTATVGLHGSGLRIEEHRRELIVTNPADPERGQVCIALDDGQVSWERTQTDYWGRLEGVTTTTTTQDPDSPPVPATTIIETLTAHPPSR